MSRSIATCKKCGTQFPLVGEVDGCVNCGHSELAVQPEPGDWKELAKAAADMSNDDIDAFMASLNKEYSQTQKFIAELEAEFDMDQAVRELMMDDEVADEIRREFNPTPVERTQMAKSQTPYEKAEQLKVNKIIDEAIKDWPNEPHHSHCCCDKCAPTKEERARRVTDFERSPVPKVPPESSVRLRDSKLEGNCRKCAVWNKIAPQAGSCPLRLEENRPITADGVRITRWHESCKNFRLDRNYKAQQIEIREKRKAHHSIIRAMERNS